jgi:hypothetical protein
VPTLAPAIDAPTNSPNLKRNDSPNVRNQSPEMETIHANPAT